MTTATLSSVRHLILFMRSFISDDTVKQHLK